MEYEQIDIKDNELYFDATCDPDKPKKISFTDIAAAAYRIKRGIVYSPCVPSHMSEDLDMKLYFKCEFLQHTGSFKERGARNAMMMLSPEARKHGVTAASLGNHSQGISYSGQLLDIKTTVVMPYVAPLVKVQKCRAFGADVILYGSNMTDAKRMALKLTKDMNATFINGYDNPDVIAGAGTIALEILDQVPDVEAILVPVGGGGLLCGTIIVVKHLKPDCLVYGIETEKCASMTESIKAGKVVPFPITRTVADGLAVSMVGYNVMHNIKSLVNKMVVVTEDATATAILQLVELEKYVIEGAGATPVAACISGLVPELRGKKVVCVLSGGNIDTTTLTACVDRGLVSEQRLSKFKVNIACTPHSFAELTTHLAAIGIIIKEIHQERIWLQGTIFSVRIKVVCETRGPAHVKELRELISSKYKECSFLKECRSAITGVRRLTTGSLTEITAASVAAMERKI